MNSDGTKAVEPARAEGPAPEHEALWDEILKKIAPTADPEQDALWQGAVEEVQHKDARQLLDGMEAQGQGQ